MFLILLLKSIEGYFLEISTVLVSFFIIICFSNYIRIFYYISKLPGPPAYPIVGNALLLLGKHEEVTHRLLFTIFETYGSFIRAWFGPMPIVATIDPEIIQEVLNNKHALEKGFLMKNVLKKSLKNSLLISDVPKWTHNRKIVVRGFTAVIIKSYFQIFVEKSLILTEKLDTKLNGAESFDIFDYLSKTSLDSICSSTMGVNMDSQNDETSYFSAIESILYLCINRIYNFWQIPDFIYSFTENGKKFIESISAAMELPNEVRNLNMILRKIIALPSILLFKVILQKKEILNNSINNNFTEFEDNVKNQFRKPLLEYLIDFTATNSEFTDEDIRNEANLIIMAGYETTARSLSYVLLNLALNKDIQNKVCEELFQVLGGDLNRSIDLNDLPKLKYMEMVIKESMRLHTTVPFLIRDTSKDIKFGDKLIPKGISCIISIFSLHRNAKIWENPLKFDPERFTPENSKNRHPYAYIPFSGGPRNCIGMRYAWMLMKTVLATLLSRYEFHTDLNIDEFEYEFAISLKPVGGHQVRITPRNKDILKTMSHENT